MNKVNDQYYQQLHELQAIDFVLVELNLYLNTHPQDEQALSQFNHYAQQRRRLVEQFEAAHGPLLNFGLSYSSSPWQWNEAPWPWQV